MAGNQGHRHVKIAIYPFYYSDINKDAKDGYLQAGDIIVGNDVWIETKAVIIPGVKIGGGAVI